MSNVFPIWIRFALQYFRGAICFRYWLPITLLHFQWESLFQWWLGCFSLVYYDWGSYYFERVNIHHYTGNKCYLFNPFICIKEYNINSLRHFNDLIACFLVLPGFAKYMHTWWWSDIKKLCEIVIGKIFHQIIYLKHHTCL